MNYYLQVLMVIGINIILAVSLNLVSGFTGQLSLGHATFMGIGAYTATLLALKLHVPFLIAIIIGAVTAAFFGFIIGVPTLRLRGDYLAIATLGFGEIMRNILLNLKITGGPMGLRGIPKVTNIYIVAAAVIMVIFSLNRIMNSRVGKAFIAIREDELAAEAMGINTTNYKILAFAIGAFYAGIAGGLFAFLFRYINPNNFGFMKSIEILCMVVLGGMGNTAGAILGAAMLTILPEFLRSVSPVISQYRMVFYGLLLVVMMIVRPQGLLSDTSFSFLKSSMFRKMRPGKIARREGNESDAS
ncbi:branched-chain amino acid ABC transporter permease [Biomaibacter acetigenes]|jgi:branched-chain amino acid transport system permease protein|uniref:Branched-chain amino acid ABC transporter permease n=1 Tax=Biomaibacter acetigenes TaxID=2316383 RepID=A0A3G2R883_9FIRM|nr:branched-chain amino acid ABC transporter permease [Biomaibacter acetigenes]AYO31585.1 branched-chain amino acid ABC transporter permease [Biomaibacter acetigenes]RKL62132.1 branched-chain amino acid ABC transporter permease [Thermoanaerobacteraceae bacterium SP2]